MKAHLWHTAFKPATGGAPQNATTRMLLLVTKLHKNGVLSAEAKGRVKDQVLRGTITEAELQRQYGSAAAVHTRNFSTTFNPFAPSAKKHQEATWSTVEGTLLVLDGDSIQPSSKIASFDMDDTLITPKSGRAFATGRNDWRWWNPSVPQRLTELHQQGYKLVIFTNQAGIAKGNARACDIQGKIQDLAAELGLPLQAFVATSEDKWRKPSTVMWDYFIKHHNGNVAVDNQQSFYCGDAAGRIKAWDGNPHTAKDHSCSDRKFARNVALPFQIPETCFLGQPDTQHFDWGSIEPTTAMQSAGAKAYEGNLTASSQEMVICVGTAPAQEQSGKSTFTKRNLVPQGYVHINQDTLHTKSACLQATEKALAQGKSVVIDNTNPSDSARALYINIAKERGVPVRCFTFKTPIELAQHLNVYRENMSGVKRVPGIAYNMFKKQYVEPRLAEGFTEIKPITFVPQFDNPDQEKLFHQLT
ncbi:DNA 3'phosphatase [Acanthamoeba castellanii str. Neff]|uniref:DNA 3'phosphatase n=1 Tax=Acanthamoeba castellanii (strain ATCC 30010 / Neff) TaxID=1257118 RepID=L8HIQ5_ACACF|nr:DNA 3'phosphatase [Acanthamoeba castellanii str. Neff]ELR24286.1 DNA 3'phosphatase [Acanthamoeba castellanii str. Neff]